MRRTLFFAFSFVGTAFLSALLFAAEDGAKMLDEAWVKAVKAGDIEAVVKLYAPDAVLFPPGEMEAKGHDAIRAAWGGMLTANKVKDVRLYEATYRTSGNLSAGWARFSMTLEPKTGGTAVTLEGRFVDVAVKRNGTWVYVADHASVPVPPPPAK